MYPGWTFAVTPHTPPILTRHVATALLSLDPKSTPSGFEVSFATDYARVNDLLKTLRIGPYAYLREWTLRGFLKSPGRFDARCQHLRLRGSCIGCGLKRWSVSVLPNWRKHGIASGLPKYRQERPPTSSIACTASRLSESCRLFCA